MYSSGGRNDWIDFRGQNQWRLVFQCYWHGQKPSMWMQSLTLVHHCTDIVKGWRVRAGTNLEMHEQDQASPTWPRCRFGKVILNGSFGNNPSELLRAYGKKRWWVMAEYFISYQNKSNEEKELLVLNGTLERQTSFTSLFCCCHPSSSCCSSSLSLSLSLTRSS